MTKVLSDSSKTTCFTELLAVDDHDQEERENYEVGKHLLTMATHDFAVMNCIPGVEDFDPLSGEVCRYYLRLVSHCDGIIRLYARYPSACECIWLLNPALKESRVVLCDRYMVASKLVQWDSVMILKLMITKLLSLSLHFQFTMVHMQQPSFIP